MVPCRGPRPEGAGQPFEHGGEELLLQLEMGGLVLERLDVDRADVRGEATAGESVVAAGNDQRREHQCGFKERAASRCPEETLPHLRHYPAPGPAPRRRPSRGI